MTDFNTKIFREYDIRGAADRDLPDSLVTLIGKAIGTFLVRAGGKTIALSQDCRVHSPRIHAALKSGLLSTPVHVVDVGVGPTPLLYFSPIHLELDAGIQITGSHNPPEDNGIKLVAMGKSVYGQAIQDLLELILKKDFVSGTGTSTTAETSAAYLDNARSHLRMGKRRCKVVLDAGNGAGGPLGLALYKSLGFDVVPLYCEMDGRFPNHHPDPTQPENLEELIATVKREGAEIGIAFDGDADRIGVVDPQGRIVWGDQLMILFARAILKEVPGATFVGEVKCSQSMYDEIERAGGKAIMWKVGHSLLKTKMKESGAVLAGEMSGHIFFAHRYLGYDDALYAGARLLEILSQSDELFSSYVDTLPVMINTPELRVEVPDDIKFELVRRTVEHFRKLYPVVDIDGVRVRYPKGWGLVRASNTQPALVMRFEAETAADLEKIQSEMSSAVTAIRAKIATGQPA